MDHKCGKILILLLFTILLLAFPVSAENTTNQTSISETLTSSNTSEQSIPLFDQNVSVNDNETNAMAELLSFIPENLWDEVNPESVYLFFHPNQSSESSHSYGYIPDPTIIVKKSENNNGMLFTTASPYVGDLPPSY